MPRLIRSLIILLFLPFWGISQVTVDFTSPGSQTWVCPANVTQIMVQCWGGGGGGGNSNYSQGSGGGGGGGGAFSSSLLNVIPGNIYYLSIGSGGQFAGANSFMTASNGQSSWFSINNTIPQNSQQGVLAVGGAAGPNGGNGGGQGGSIFNSIGQIKYNGGNGYTGDWNGGGGGGSSAGTNSAGVNATSFLGATAPINGGYGGSGSMNVSQGQNGGFPGGGGGGSDDWQGSAGGWGIGGKISLTYINNCNGVPPSPIINSNSNQGCGAISLFLSNYSFSPGLTLQWQSSSSANGPWSNIPNANDTTLAYNCFSDTYFRLTVTCLYSNASVTSNVIFYDFQSNPALVAPSAQNLNVTCGQNTTITSVGGSGNGYLWSPQIQDTSYQGTNQWVLNSVNNDTTVYVQTYINPPTLNSTVNITNNNQLIGFNVNNCGAGNYQGSGSVGLTWNNNLPQGSVITSCQLVLNVGIECNAGVKNTTINGQAGPSFSTTANCVCVGFAPYTLTINPALLNANGSNTFLITNANNLGLTNSMNGTNGNYAQVLISYNIGQPCVSQSAPITLTVQQPVSAGTISSSQTICAGNAPQNLTFNGLNGNIQWQYASTLAGPWTSIPGATTATLTGAQMVQTYIFTNAGASGAIGPTQAQLNSAYTGTNLAGSVTSSNGIQLWTVPTTGVYTIDARGACGGTYPGRTAGGNGARMVGTFNLTAGQQIKILVGQEGYYGGGGGGSFVATSANVPLIVAGGGGGGGSACGGNPPHAGTALNGSNNYNACGHVSYNGGTNGSGGNGPGLNGGPGGGFNTNGTPGDGNAGIAFINGGNGGANGNFFGGFGAGGGSTDDQGAGGGGYSGGAGDFEDGNGGGGGSYNTGTNQINTAGFQAGMGQVVISRILNSTQYFSVQVSNIGCNPSTSNVITLTVNPLPIVNAGVDQTICIGSQTTVSATGANSYVWSNGITNNVPFVVTAAQTLTVTGTDINGCTNTDQLSISTLVSATGGTSSSTITSYCVGSNAQANVTLAGHYGQIQWQYATNINGPWSNFPGATTTTLNTTTITNTIGALNTTTYIRAQLSWGNCPNAYSTVTTLTVYNFSIAGSIATNQTICSGTLPDTLMLNGYVGNNFTWQVSTNGSTWTTISNSNNPFLLPSQMGSLTSNRYYRVLVTNGPCSQQVTASILITVSANPTVGTASSSQTICIGSTQSNLSLNSWTGNLQWQSSTNLVNWSNIAGATSSSLTVAQMGGNLSTTTYYRVVVSNGAVCNPVNSNTVTITVVPQANAGNISPNDTVCYNTQPNNIALTNYTSTSISWQISTNGSTWNGIGTNSNILLGSQIGAITSTRYIRAYVQNSPCSGVYSLICTLYVAPLPVGGTISSNQTICQNSTPSALVLSGNYVGNLQWQFSSNNINWTNIPNQTSSTLSSGAIGSLTNSTYYRVMVMSEPCTPVYSNVILITVTPSSNPGTITSNQTICTGSAPANLISNNTNGVLQWQYASNIAGPWINIAGANSSILTSGQMGALTTTRYFRLVSTNGSCPSAASNIVTITVSPQSNAGSISGPSYVCPGSSVNALQLMGNVGSIQWLVSTNINGPYTVIPNETSNSLVYGPINQSTYFKASSTSLGCATVTSSTFAVNLYNLPIINSGQNQTICNGQTATLTASGATTYIWSNQLIGSIIGNTSSVQVSPQQNTTYNVVGTDNNGCSNSSSVTVSVNPLPTATLSNTGPNNVCEEQGVLLVVNGLNLTYQWNSNNNPIQGATFSSFLAQSSGNYSVTITDQTTGCSNQTNGYSVSILPAPTLSIVGDSSICQGDNATFNLGSNGQTYWEGTQLSNATVTPTTTTTYQVSAISNQGCQAYATVTVVVHPNNDTTLWVTSYGPYSLNGILYDATGVYEQNVLTVHGCDSTITINLNFLENSIAELNMEYFIYPNPVLSGGHLSFSPNIPTDVPVYILSLDGKIIPTERIENIIIAPLSSGVYFLVIDLIRTKFIVSD
jgi:hypothetical protein